MSKTKKIVFTVLLGIVLVLSLTGCFLAFQHYVDGLCLDKAIPYYDTSVIWDIGQVLKSFVFRSPSPYRNMRHDLGSCFLIFVLMSLISIILIITIWIEKSKKEKHG